MTRVEKAGGIAICKTIAMRGSPVTPKNISPVPTTNGVSSILIDKQVKAFLMLRRVFNWLSCIPIMTSDRVTVVHAIVFIPDATTVGKGTNRIPRPIGKLQSAGVFAMEIKGFGGFLPLDILP